MADATVYSLSPQLSPTLIPEELICAKRNKDVIVPCLRLIWWQSPHSPWCPASVKTSSCLWLINANCRLLNTMDWRSFGTRDEAAEVKQMTVHLHWIDEQRHVLPEVHLRECHWNEGLHTLIINMSLQTETSMTSSFQSQSLKLESASSRQAPAGPDKTKPT